MPLRRAQRGFFELQFCWNHGCTRIDTDKSKRKSKNHKIEIEDQGQGIRNQNVIIKSQTANGKSKSPPRHINLYSFNSAIVLFLSVSIRVHPCASVVASFASVMEAVAQLDENLARIVPMEAAEGQAIIQHHAAVGHV